MVSEKGRGTEPPPASSGTPRLGRAPRHLHPVSGVRAGQPHQLTEVQSVSPRHPRRPPTAWEQPGRAAPTIERRRLEGAKCTMHSLPAAEQPMAGGAVLYGPAPAGGIVHRAREDVPTPTRKYQQPGAKSRRPGGDTGLLQSENVSGSVRASKPMNKHIKKHGQVNDAPATLSPAADQVRPSVTKSTALYEGRVY